MDKKTVNLLNQVNKSFYQDVFESFDDSRGYFWKGWEKLLDFLPDKQLLRVLDVGCGNGRFYEFLQSKDIEVDYLGIDNSSELLEIARDKYSEAEFKKVDIVENPNILTNYTNYDLIVSFGVFHHIPSYKLRSQMVQALSDALSPAGILTISFWQFTKSKSLMKRVVDWDAIEIPPSDVERGDYLLDWQRGNNALRYCHVVNEKEMNSFVDEANIDLIDSFTADGRSGDLNLYLVGKKG